MSSLLISSLCNPNGGGVFPVVTTEEIISPTGVLRINGSNNYGVVTLAQLKAITGELAGDIAHVFDYGRWAEWDGLAWIFPGDTCRLLNSNGAALAEQVVVKHDATTDRGCVTNTVIYDPKTAGVVVVGAADTEWVTVAYRGIWRADVTGAVIRGNYVESGSTAGTFVNAGGPYSGNSGICVESAAGGSALVSLNCTEMF